MKKITREDALEYHRRLPHGKIEVVPTKPTATQVDLSLAYTPGVAEPCLEIAADPMAAWDYTAQRQPGRRRHQRHRRARTRRHRGARRQAGDGRQGCPVQALRRHRRLRHRARDPRPGGDHPDRPPARADLRRHQPRGHQGAGVLRDRAALEEGNVDPRLPRRPARHGDHLGRRARQRLRAGGQAARGRAHRVRRRRRRCLRLRLALRAARRAQGEHGPLRPQGRHLARPARGDRSLQDRVRVHHGGANPRGGARRRRRLRRPLRSGCRDRRDAQGHGARSDRLRHGQSDPRDSLGGGRRRALGRHHGDRPQRLSQPGQQRPRLPLPLPRRARHPRDRHQRRDEAGGDARAGGARARGRARFGAQGLWPRVAPVRPRVPDSQALRLPGAAHRRSGSGARGRAERRRPAAGRRLRRLSPPARAARVAPHAAHARDRRPGAAGAEADRLPGRGERPHPARRQGPGGRGHRAAGADRPAAAHRGPPRGARPLGGEDRDRRSRRVAAARRLPPAPLGAPPARRRAARRGGAPAALAELLRHDDGRAGGRRRPDRRRHLRISRDDPPRAPGRRHEDRLSPRRRRLHPAAARPA